MAIVIDFCGVLALRDILHLVEGMSQGVRCTRLSTKGKYQRVASCKFLWAATVFPDSLYVFPSAASMIITLIACAAPAFLGFAPR